jgi:type IV secretion system protein VirB5
MDKSKRILSITLALIIGGAQLPAMATGIPTVDVAGIAQMALNAAEQATQAAAQLAEAKRAIEEAQQQFEQTKRLITGNSGYGSRYNNKDLVDYLPTTATMGSWEKIYSSMDSGTLNGLRDKYGLRSKNALQQEVFDKQLAHLHTSEAAFNANNLRLENIKNLQAEADQAQTPQEKQDINTRMAAEQAAIANEANRLASAQELMERQEKLYKQKQNQQFDDFMSTGKE